MTQHTFNPTQHEPTKEWFIRTMREMTNRMQASLSELLLLQENDAGFNDKLRDVEKQQNAISFFNRCYMHLLKPITFSK